MNNLVSLSLAIILFFASQLFAAPWDQNLPLQTAEEKATAFLKIHTLIPTMADGAVRYGFDPIALFDHQIQIEKMVSEDPLYQNLKTSHKDLIEFLVFDNLSSNTAVSDKEVNWTNWQQRSNQFVRSLKLNSEQEIAAEINKILGSPLLGKTQGIVAGLSNLIPGNLKKEFFSMPLENKIQLLNLNLPEEIISQGFVPSRLGWTDTAISREEIVDRLSTAVNMEQRLTFLLVHHYSSLQNITTPKDYLNRWELDPKLKKVLDQWFNSNVAKLIPTEQTSAVPNLILHEVPPVVSIFRGFAGNDCSTSFSFPFVNSPNEFTFLVYDSNGSVKGYAQGTRVSVKGADSFYLHTIAGPRISTNDALTIIKTFLQEKHTMGFKEVLLPPMEKVEGLINFIPIREAYKLVTTDSEERLNYKDTALRENFKSTFKLISSYDDAGSNLVGYKIDEKKLGAALKVEQKQSPSIELVSTHIDKKDLLLMLLQMGKNYEKNRTMIETLARQAYLNPTDVANLIILSKNPEKLVLNKFIGKFEQALKDQGFSFPAEFFKKNISILNLGLAQADDFLENKELSEKVLLNLLEQRELSVVENLLLANPTTFKNKSITYSFLKSFYNDIHEAENKEPQALEAALQQNPQAILKNGELMGMLSKNAKASSTINSFLVENPMLIQTLPKDGGAPFFAAHKLRITILNSTLKAARDAKTEKDFTKATSLAEIKNLRASSEEARHMQVEIYIQTIDHYLSLQPKSSLYSIIRTLHSSASKSDNAVRALRKLLPLALKSASWELNTYLKMAVYLKSRSANPEAIDKMVKDAVLAHQDLKKTNILVEKYFSGLNLVNRKALVCGGIFSSTP